MRWCRPTALLMEGLSALGTRGKHVNARSVQHLMGYLKNELSAEDKQELLGVIEEYRQGMVPLIAHDPAEASFAAASGARVGVARRSGCT
jgi:uncharacterized protein YbgA (DUF1722 family)